MMRTLYFSCSLLGLLVPLAHAGSLAVSFHDCGDASTDVVVKDVTPKTIATGSTTTITGSGSLKKDITGATYTMTMTGVLSTVLVKSCKGDASQANTCDIVAPLLGKIGTLAYEPVTFPIKAGDITGIPKVAVTVKSGLPASLETTTTTLKVTGSNGDKAICVQIMTKAATGASDISMVNPLTVPVSHPAISSLRGHVTLQEGAGSLAVSFHDCGDASTDAVVKDVTPKTIATGSTTTITGSGSLKKDITGATYTMTMTGVLSTVLVKNCNGDASKSNTCDIVAPLLGKVGTLAYQPVTFPVKAGDITGIPKVAVTLNSGLPASLETTTTTLKVTASNGDKAICVQIMTQAAGGSSDWIGTIMSKAATDAYYIISKIGTNTGGTVNVAVPNSGINVITNSDVNMGSHSGGAINVAVPNSGVNTGTDSHINMGTHSDGAINVAVPNSGINAVTNSDINMGTHSGGAVNVAVPNSGINTGTDSHINMGTTTGGTNTGDTNTGNINVAVPNSGINAVTNSDINMGTHTGGDINVAVPNSGINTGTDSHINMGTKTGGANTAGTNSDMISKIGTNTSDTNTGTFAVNVAVPNSGINVVTNSDINIGTRTDGAVNVAVPNSGINVVTNSDIIIATGAPSFIV